MTPLIARAARFWVPLACIAALSFPTSLRTILYRQLYPHVPVDARQLAAAPASLRSLGYREDDPADLSDFHALAESAVRGATTDGQRLRQLCDMLYSLRSANPPWIDGGREQGVQRLLARITNGERGLCGHTTLVLAAMWRSLGRDFREIRFTMSEDEAWFAHYGIEVYSPDSGRWMYYDVGLNGYAVDDAGTPLSLTELDEHLAHGEDVGIVAGTRHQDWDTATFLSFLRQHQLQVFSLNNELRAFDRDRRFGPMNFAYGLFSKLPRPLDRVIDALTGDLGPRLTLSTRSAPPSDSATMHLTASPVG